MLQNSVGQDLSSILRQLPDFDVKEVVQRFKDMMQKLGVRSWKPHNISDEGVFACSHFDESDYSL